LVAVSLNCGAAVRRVLGRQEGWQLGLDLFQADRGPRHAEAFERLFRDRFAGGGCAVDLNFLIGFGEFGFPAGALRLDMSEDGPRLLGLVAQHGSADEPEHLVQSFGVVPGRGSVTGCAERERFLNAVAFAFVTEGRRADRTQGRSFEVQLSV
jgi:hypothetical protein